MGYRQEMQDIHEDVQCLVLAADARYLEAHALAEESPHSAIYLGGLAAEMYLKTSLFYLCGARPAETSRAWSRRIRNAAPPVRVDDEWESGHGLWFWYLELMEERLRQGKSTPARLVRYSGVLYNDWIIEMRYRAGHATLSQARSFLEAVDWLYQSQGLLRR